MFKFLWALPISIENFSRRTFALASHLKRGKKRKFDIIFKIIHETFRDIKHAFITTPLLLHFDKKNSVKN